MNVAELKFYLGNNWNKPLQAISALGLCISSFFATPETAIGLTSEEAFLSFGRVFVIVITWLTVSVFVSRLRKRRNTMTWLKVGLAAFVLAIGAFVLYYSLLNLWTFKSQNYGNVLVDGNSYTDDAVMNRINVAAVIEKREISREEAVKILDSMPKDELLNIFGGDINSIWDWKALFYRRVGIGLTYLLSLPIFCVALLATIQASYCARRGQ